MTATTSGRARGRAGSGSFYSWIAVGFVLAAFLGFFPTYWQPLTAGKFVANPVVHIHGLFFFGWTLFYWWQTSLVSAGQTARHREAGLIGISLASVMSVLGVLVALNALTSGIAAGARAQAEAGSILPLGDIVPFAIFVTLAILNRTRSETHKRFMLLSMVTILDAPLARPLLAYGLLGIPPGPPPVWIEYYAGGLADLFLVAAVIYDWRKMGRVHPVYVWAGGALVIFQILKFPISETAAWHGLMRDFAGLTGVFPAHPG